MPPNRTTTTIWTKVQNLEAAAQQNLTILAATHCMYTENRNLLYFTLISNSRLTENIWTHYFSFFILTNKLIFGQRTRRGWWPKHSHICWGANKDQIWKVKTFFSIFLISLIYIFFIKENNYYIIFFLVLHRKSFVDKRESAEQVKRGVKRRNSKENLILQLDLSWGKF